MRGWSYFWLLEKHAVDILWLACPITLFFSVLLAFAISRALVVDRKPWRLLRSLILLGLPAAAVPVGLLAIGTVFCYEGDAPYSERQGSGTGWMLFRLVFFGQLPIAGVACWRAGSNWPVIAAAWALAGWCSLPAALLAGMSISGQWL